jgi:hypothetical protein
MRTCAFLSVLFLPFPSSIQGRERMRLMLEHAQTLRLPRSHPNQRPRRRLELRLRLLSDTFPFALRLFALLLHPLRLSLVFLPLPTPPFVSPPNPILASPRLDFFPSFLPLFSTRPAFSLSFVFRPFLFL